MDNISSDVDLKTIQVEPNTWPQLMWRIRWVFLGLILILLICITVIILGFRDTLSKVLSSNIAVIKEVQKLQNIPQPGAKFASFKTEWPKTDQGHPFNIFTDSTFSGKSTINYSMKQHSAQKDYYIQLNFALDRDGRQILDAYAGVYAEWSEPPSKIQDISKYNGISFKCRRNLTSGNSNTLKLLISIAMDGVRDYAYHEYDFSRLLSSNQRTLFQEIKVPFSELKTPSYSNAPIQFDPKAVFRISLAIKGDNLVGTLDIDDLEFY